MTLDIAQDAAQLPIDVPGQHVAETLDHPAVRFHLLHDLQCLGVGMHERTTDP